MNILFTTNFPAPYRVEFFNELGKYCNLTVAYERKKALHRDEKWVGNPAVNFEEMYLKLKPVGTSQSRGLDLVKYISKNKFDIIVFGGYASPSVMMAMEYCQLTKKRYYIEYDGSFFKKDSFVKGIIKKHLIKGAEGNFITCDETEKYLNSLGVSKERIFYYPFSSLHERDILEEPLSCEEKKQKKAELGIHEEVAIISVGQFIYRKGFDILLNAIKTIDRKVGVYIIGGEPTEEYLDICNRHNLGNVHFYPFCEREELFEWYKACDLFVFPTREDIWGLVVNEAMACGLPIISSNMSIAARELLKDGQAGTLYDYDDCVQLAEQIDWLLAQEQNPYSEASLQTIRNYTIEEMAATHMKAWKNVKAHN